MSNFFWKKIIFNPIPNNFFSQSFHFNWLHEALGQHYSKTSKSSWNKNQTCTLTTSKNGRINLNLWKNRTTSSNLNICHRKHFINVTISIDTLHLAYSIFLGLRVTIHTRNGLRLLTASKRQELIHLLLVVSVHTL